MQATTANILLLLPPFLLVLFRITGLTLTAPLFSGPGIPGRMKIAFAVVLSLLIAPTVWHRLPLNLTLGHMLVAVTGELLVGLILGLSAGMLFIGARITGMMIGQQAGIGLGQVVNPMLDGQTTLLGQLYYLCFMVVWLAIGGHRAMMRALLDTYQTVPPGAFRFEASHLELIERLLTAAFNMAIRLAAPALIALFMTSVTMGFLSRTIPQLNVLTIGFAARIFVGMFIAAVALPHAFDIIHEAVITTMDRIQFTLGTSG